MARSRRMSAKHAIERTAVNHDDRPPELPLSALTFIDLFCGCGGFTLGLLRAGFRCLAAIDSNHEALSTLRANLVEQPDLTFPPVAHVLERDLTRFAPGDLAALLGIDHVGVIVGGPPCQGFSTARQVDGANHGARLKHDLRRFLYREFLRYVEFFQPRVFVMENVLGLRSAVGGEHFTRVQHEARNLDKSRGRHGYRVHGQVEDAWELGVPQKRRRQLIIGVRNDLPGYFLPRLEPASRSEPRIPLGAAICDLPVLRAGDGADERDYDLVRRAGHLSRGGTIPRKYLFKVLEAGRARRLTNHVARPHSDRDLRDFARLREGENSATAMRDRSVRFEFPYDKSSFKDRYTRQSRWKPCSTIVAHLSKDGLMFIHPTQNRSLTPREAARIQSFPDWFRFPKARTHAFRLIGNAVPPLIAESIGSAVRKFFVTSYSQSTRIPLEGVRRVRSGSGISDPIRPWDRREAVQRLMGISRCDQRQLRTMHAREILRVWHDLLLLFPELHPDNARDHGAKIETIPNVQGSLPGFEPIASRRYVRSGWPVELELIGLEAWRRFESGELTGEEFYCTRPTPLFSPGRGQRIPNQLRPARLEKGRAEFVRS